MNRNPLAGWHTKGENKHLKDRMELGDSPDLLWVAPVAGEAPGLLHLLLPRGVPAVVVPPHNLRVLQGLHDDLLLPGLAKGAGPGGRKHD